MCDLRSSLEATATPSPSPARALRSPAATLGRPGGRPPRSARTSVRAPSRSCDPRSLRKRPPPPGLLSRRHVQAVPILDHPEEGRPPQHRSRPGRRSSCHLRFSGVSKATATPIVGPGGLSWASSCDPRPSGRTTATPSDLSLPSDSGLLRSSAFPRGDRHCEVPPSAARVHRFAILGRSAGRPQAASAGAAINKHQFPIPVAALLGRPEVRPPSRSGGRPSPCPCPCDSRPSKERRPPPDPDRGCVGP